MIFEGFINKLNVKEGRNKRGPWTSWSAKIENPEGVEYDQWVSLGFKNPNVKEGDYIQLQAQEENGRMSLIEGSLKGPKKNPPARGGQKSKASSPKSGPKNSSASTSDSSSQDSAPATGVSNAEKDARISFQSARNAAIELVGLLLLNKALPVTAADTKAGQAKRFDEITAAVEKLTVEFFIDSNTQRLLERVADAGEVKADSKSKSDLPADAKESDAEEEGPLGEDDEWGDAA